MQATSALIGDVDRPPVPRRHVDLERVQVAADDALPYESGIREQDRLVDTEQVQMSETGPGIGVVERRVVVVDVGPGTITIPLATGTGAVDVARLEHLGRIDALALPRDPTEALVIVDDANADIAVGRGSMLGPQLPPLEQMLVGVDQRCHVCPPLSAGTIVPGN
jgi:hypothetical protein